MIYVAKHIKKW